MLCKIFKRGAGRASGIDYLMSLKDASGLQRNPPADLLKGEIATTKKLISNCRFAQRYTSGVLSWSENPDSITSEQIEQVIESFQEMVGAGLSNERLNWLWVKHQDKGRLELHFVIPNVDLLSGKRFAPYFDRADRPLFRSWERLINTTHGFTNPADPALKRATVVPAYLPQDKQKAQEVINARLTFLWRAGHLKSREDVINNLTSLGFQINRAGKDYISIKDKANRKLRLRGTLFEMDFKLPAKIETSPGNLQELCSLQVQFNTQLEKRTRYIKARYDKTGDVFEDIKPINFINVKESLDEGVTAISSVINEEHRAVANEAVSKFETAARSLAATIELFVASANQLIERLRNYRPQCPNIFH